MFSRISEILENPETASKIKEIAASMGGANGVSGSNSADNNMNSSSSSADFYNSDSSPSSESDNNNFDSVMNNFESENGAAQETAAPLAATAATDGGLGFDMSKLNSMVSGMNNTTNKHIVLLNAMRPYMRSSRADKITTAIKAIQIINVLGNLR